MEKEEKHADQENGTEEQSTEAKSLLKKKLQYYSGEIQRDVGNLVKWLMIAVLVGCITGAASTLFSFARGCRISGRFPPVWEEIQRNGQSTHAVPGRNTGENVATSCP